MMVPFIGVWRFVWTHKGDMCVFVCDLGELTVHLGGDGSGESGLLMGQTVSWGDGGVILPPPKVNLSLPWYVCRTLWTLGGLQNRTEAKSKSSWRCADDSQMVKGTQKAELLVLASFLQRAVCFHKVNGFPTLLHGETCGTSTPAARVQADLFLPWQIPWHYITNKAHLGLMNPWFVPSTKHGRCSCKLLGLCVCRVQRGDSRAAAGPSMFLTASTIAPLPLPSGVQLCETSEHTTSRL